MNSIEQFIERIEGFSDSTASRAIDYFAYYKLIILKQDGFVAKDIANCFEELHLEPYSNIPSYLSKNSKGKNKKYLRKNGSKYYLERSVKKSIDDLIGNKTIPTNVTSAFYSNEIFDNTRSYLKSLSNQVLESYNQGIYDGCAVLLRKLVEVLIIECFEKYEIESQIKNDNGSFYYLSDLITEFLKEPKWNVSRNAKKGLPKIKKIGDLAAHNRRYISRKNDLDSIRDEIRVVFGELINLIDYPNWK